MSHLSPAPALGFSGAAALDGNGKFAGIALLKPVQVAGPANDAPAAQAVLVTADTVRGFLESNGVNIAGGSADAKASVVRVICVRSRLWYRHALGDRSAAPYSSDSVRTKFSVIIPSSKLIRASRRRVE